MTKIFVLIAFLIGGNWAFYSNAFAQEKGGEVGNPVLNTTSEVKCDIKNTYILRSDDKVLSSFTEEDGVSWPESSDNKIGFEKKYIMDMGQLIENVHDPIDGLSIEETKEVLGAASKATEFYTWGGSEPTNIKLGAPENGFFGFGKKGDWKTGKVPFSISTGGNFVLSTNGSIEENHKETKVNLLAYEYASGIREELRKKTTKGLGDITITTEASFKCLNQKYATNEVNKEVNNTARTNFKGSVPVNEKSESIKPAPTSQK